MNVLIACERSGVVREAFRRRGHNAYSCDLVSPDDDSAHHLVGDALKIIKGGWRDRPWDLVIAHPPCTRLSNSGALRLYKGGKFENGRDIFKWDEMDRAALFFRQFFVVSAESGVPKLCVENPIQHGHAYEAHACGKPTQIVQPWEFGDDASKATCLWLRNLPELRQTLLIKPRIVIGANGRKYPRWANQTDSGQNRLGPSPNRAKIRAQTYPGIAEAMAEQWGGALVANL